MLYNIDVGADEYIAHFTRETTEKKPVQPAGGGHTLVEAVCKGLADEAKTLCNDALKTEQPLDVVNGYLIPALDVVGAEFEAGKLFLPQLLSAGQTRRRPHLKP